MNYQEAIQHSLTVKWKTTPCHSGESCWCRVIKPEQEIKDNNGNEIYIAGSGCLHKDYAEHIVKLHNASLNMVAKRNTDIQSVFTEPASINNDEYICPDCGDRGWLYDIEGAFLEICPCHY